MVEPYAVDLKEICCQQYFAVVNLWYILGKSGRYFAMVALGLSNN